MDNNLLLSWLAEVRGDPLAFTMGAYPWGQPGTVLEKFDGPDEWSRELFEQIRLGILDTNKAIQIATASGHGIGKSATVAMIILWAFCTAPDTRGIVTANTETQLRTKTWAELGSLAGFEFGDPPSDASKAVIEIDVGKQSGREPANSMTSQGGLVIEPIGE